MKFKTKLLTVALAMMLVAMVAPLTVIANTATATPSAHTVQIDGELVAFRAFLINGNNFFMLRDIAYALSDSPAQFEVSWDESLGAINLLSGVVYTLVGGEMQEAAVVAEVATPSTVAVLVNGSPDE